MVTAPLVDVVYLAHPVGAPDRFAVDANLARAGRWLRWLLEMETDVAIIAPWLATMLAGVQDDMNPEHRRRGMRDNLATVARCSGIVLVGGRVSSGMGDELDVAIGSGVWVSSLTLLGDEPPASWDFDRGPLAVGRDAWSAVQHAWRAP